MVRSSKLMSPELSEALAEGDINSITQLVEQGESVNAIDGNTGQKLILWASENGYTDFASFLIDRGAKIEDRDVDGNTPLMHASRLGNVKLVRLFLEKGANPNRRNSSGGDAMFKAMVGKFNGPVSQHDEVIKVLIQYGAKELPE